MVEIIRTTAPGRAGIVGNPTDGYGGSVISTSIAQRAWCELRPADRWKLHVGSADQVVESDADLQLRGDHADVARAVLRRLWPMPPANLIAGTSIPIQAGLSGSTAILTAILAAVLEHSGRQMPPHALAEEARAIEFEVLKVICGFQDHYMIVFGGANYMDFRGKEPGAGMDQPWATVESLPVHGIGCHLLLAHTGVQRVSGSIHKGLRERWIDGERAVVEGYIRIAALAREAKKAIVTRDWPRLGGLMIENHAIQRDLGGSGESNERLIKAALDGGALGAKLAGAGGGGTILALCDDVSRVRASLEQARAEHVWLVEPSAGLKIERIEAEEG